MSKNVVILQNVTRLDIPPERVLEAALKADLKRAFVIGETQDGETYFASSIADGADVVWLMEICKEALLRGSLME